MEVVVETQLLIPFSHGAGPSLVRLMTRARRFASKIVNVTGKGTEVLRNNENCEGSSKLDGIQSHGDARKRLNYKPQTVPLSEGMIIWQR
jgi:hypothetical protein